MTIEQAHAEKVRRERREQNERPSLKDVVLDELAEARRAARRYDAAAELMRLLCRHPEAERAIELAQKLGIRLCAADGTAEEI